MTNPEEPIRAATERVQNLLYAHAAEVVSQGYPATVTDGHPDPWVHALGDQVLDRLRDRRYRCCRHLLTGPQVIVTAAWRLELFVCEACAAAGAHDLHGIEDTRCDRCGRLSPNGIHACQATVGPILVHYGLCPGCYQQVDAAAVAHLRHQRRRGKEPPPP